MHTTRQRSTSGRSVASSQSCCRVALSSKVWRLEMCVDMCLDMPSCCRVALSSKAPSIRPFKGLVFRHVCRHVFRHYNTDQLAQIMKIRDQLV